MERVSDNSPQSALRQPIWPAVPLETPLGEGILKALGAGCGLAFQVTFTPSPEMDKDALIRAIRQNKLGQADSGEGDIVHIVTGVPEIRRVMRMRGVSEALTLSGDDRLGNQDDPVRVSQVILAKGDDAFWEQVDVMDRALMMPVLLRPNLSAWAQRLPNETAASLDMAAAKGLLDLLRRDYRIGLSSVQMAADPQNQQPALLAVMAPDALGRAALLPEVGRVAPWHWQRIEVRRGAELVDLLVAAAVSLDTLPRPLPSTEQIQYYGSGGDSRTLKPPSGRFSRGGG